MSTSSQILEAVKNRDLASKQGVLQKLFAVWFDAFVYNQIWEDPRVDLEALKLDKNSRVLTISSGGCNALNYLLAGPESVTAVDLNRHHVYLLDLKAAAVKNLPKYEQFLELFGVGKTEDPHEIYKEFLAPDLDEKAKQVWNKRIKIFKKGGLYNHSRNGYFLRIFQRFARMIGCRPDAVLHARSKTEQARLYAKHIEPFFENFLIKLVGKMPVTLFGLGIPPQQFDELTRNLDGGRTIIDIYRERVRRLACDFPIDENYFAWQAFARKYDTENHKAIPEYLKPENFEKLKANIGCLRAKVGSVTDEIKTSRYGAFNRFVFLDAQDWMDTGALTDLWSAIAEKAEPNSRIIFRTAGAESPIETRLPLTLRENFVYEKDASDRLFKQDRASIYGGFHLYVLK
ncbi:MAG TPA: BtaA family protein [Pyrinomonadaceae bacterium]|nr:BtaA family protein [Pyrinomonadaceae bacterium]